MPVDGVPVLQPQPALAPTYKPVQVKAGATTGGALYAGLRSAAAALPREMAPSATPARSPTVIRRIATLPQTTRHAAIKRTTINGIEAGGHQQANLGRVFLFCHTPPRQP